MKRFPTLLILVFAFLKLSASAMCNDTLSVLASLNISKNPKPSATVFPTEHLMALLTSNNFDTLKLSEPVNILDSVNLPAAVLHPGNLKSPVGTFLPDSQRASVPAQSLQKITLQIKSYGLDSLKQFVKSAASDSIKGLLYTEIATRYLNYDTISNKKQQLNYQNEALIYTMMALRKYSICNNNPGLRVSFDNLAKVYFSQKKYSQAKWFILQSNSLSRAEKDVPNIITSLLTLSAIKSEIKDYKLAISDLNEALQLSVTNHYPLMEMDVLKNYALLYSRLQDYPKEELMLKKRESLGENIHGKEEARLLAKAALQDSVQKKKLDSLQNAKKVYISNTKKLYKNSSFRKMASL
jgi:tetratricopeptide (TPR) repeat protein